MRSIIGTAFNVLRTIKSIIKLAILVAIGVGIYLLVQKFSPDKQEEHSSSKTTTEAIK